MSELAPFKQTKSRVAYALPIGLAEGQVTCPLPIGFLWKLSPSKPLISGQPKAE